MTRMVILGASTAVALVGVVAGCSGDGDETGAPVAALSTSSKLRIEHVPEGCHVWSDGGRRAASMRLRLGKGGVLTVLNQDVDAHRLVQVGGPKLRLGGVMPMGGRSPIAFARPGLYRLRTESVEVEEGEHMEGMMEVETEGPDNELQLEVVVR